MPRDPRAILADLARAFPRQKDLTDPATFGLYLRLLADLDPAVLDAAVTHLILAGGDWLPSVSAIREAAAELVLDLPREAAALAQIHAVIAWNRLPEASRGPAPAVHPLVRRTVYSLGGYYAFRTSDKPSVLLGQFSRLYGEARSEALHEVRAPAAALPPVPSLRAIPERTPE